MCDQANIPGTVDEHPNWRRKLPLDLERLREHPRLGEIARIAAECGRAASVVAAARWASAGTEHSETAAR